MSDTDTDLEAAQAALLHRRRALGVDRPPQRGRSPAPEPMPWHDPVRLAELEEVARLELADEGLDSQLFESLVYARARQLLRAEKDPGWLKDLEARAKSDRADALHERMERWRFPSFAVEAVSTGRNDKGEWLVESDAEAWLKAAMATGGRLVGLVGKLGTGKTLAACRWVVGEWSRIDEDDRDEKHQSILPVILYARAEEVFSYSARYDKDRRWLDRVADCQLLILDECGTKQEREDTDSKQLAALLLQRYEDNLRSIVLANMTREQFQGRYTDAVMSRLYHDGGMHYCRQVMRQGELRRQEQMKLDKAGGER